MASAGKKGKKAKWVPVNLSEILEDQTNSTASATTRKVWADDIDDDELGYSSRPRQPVVLPSVSRAARGGAVDEETIPRRPPYVAYISNLPYDIQEDSIKDLFEGLRITNILLPRDGDRLKGFGYVDFDDRESLIDAMNIPELTISGRRIRIDVSTQNNDRRMGNKRSSDRNYDYDPERTMGNWRDKPRGEPSPMSRDKDRDRDRDRDRGGDRGERGSDSGPWRSGGREFRDREPANDVPSKPGAWREGGDRPALRDPIPPRSDDRTYRTPYRDSSGGGNFRDYGDREGGRDRDRDRYGGRGSFDGRDSRDEEPRERPKLNLKPRSKPVEARPTAGAADSEGEEKETKPEGSADKEKELPRAGVAAEKIFGAAKPVDTSARELEIEGRLLRQEEELREKGESREDRKWERRADNSGDRKAAGRRNGDDVSDDRRHRDYRDSRDSRDSRDYRDSRESRDYRDTRESRDYRDSRDSRDYRDSRDSRDQKDSRDHRDDRRDYGSRESRDIRESRDYRDSRVSRDDRDSRDSRDHSQRDSRDAKDSDNDPDSKDRESRSYARSEQDSDNKEKRGDSKERRNSREKNDSRERSDSRERLGSKDRQNSRDRQDSRDRLVDSKQDSKDGKDSRDGDRREKDSSREEERPMPKLIEQQPPNFAASNKFSFLEAADADGTSD